MDQAVLEALVSRLEVVGESLRMKANHDGPHSDDLEDLAEEVQEIATVINEEVG